LILRSECCFGNLAFVFANPIAIYFDLTPLARLAPRQFAPRIPGSSVWRISMTRSKWLRSSASVALATASFLSFSFCLASRAGAQSAPSFISAPSFSLGYPATDTQLSFATGVLGSSGNPDLVTADSTAGTITVWHGDGKGGFTAAAGDTYTVGGNPTAVLVVNLRDTGKYSDVLVCNAPTGYVSVLINKDDGSGTLNALGSYPASYGVNPTPASLLAMTTENFGSGFEDVAVAGPAGLYILGNISGNGSLTLESYHNLGKTPTGIAAGKFETANNNYDLAVSNSDGSISPFYYASAYTFTWGETGTGPDIAVIGTSLSSIVAGNFGNGNTSLAVTESATGEAGVLTGNGDGTFNAPVAYSVGNDPVSVVAASVYGNAYSDLVVTNKGSDTVSVLEAKGDGTFENTIEFVTGNAPVAAVANKFYGTSDLDLAILNSASQSVTVAQGNGSSTSPLQASRSYEVGSYAGAANPAVAYGNLGGKSGGPASLPGLAIANYCGTDHTCASKGNVAVFTDASGTGVYTPASTPTYTFGTAGLGPMSVALADVNNDGILDILTVNQDKKVYVLLGNGDGTFQTPTDVASLSGSGSPLAIAAGFFNSFQGVAVLEDGSPGSVEVLLGNGADVFTEATGSPFTVGYSPISIAVGPLGTSGQSDNIFIANNCNATNCTSGGTVTELLGNGSGTFQATTSVPLPDEENTANPTSIAIGNLHNSTSSDLAVSFSNNKIAVVSGDGSGGFSADNIHVYSVGNTPTAVAIADFNGDGKQDVAVANSQDATVSVLTGNGNGTLNAATTWPVGSDPIGLAVIGATTFPTPGNASLVTVNGNASSNYATEFTVLLQKPAPTLTLALTSPSSGPVNLNTAATFTATLGGIPFTQGNPTGSISFLINGSAIADCPSVTIGGGTSTATCTTSTLVVPTDTIAASYSGDINYAPATASPITQNVTKATPTLTLALTSPSSGPVNLNTAATFTATLGGAGFAPNAPTGTISFLINGSAIGDCPSATIGGGTLTATCTTSTLVAPTDTIAASYSGDADYASATATPITPSVTQATPTLTLALTSPSSGSVSVNTQATFTATLGGVTFAPAAPTGTISFLINGSAIADCPSVTIGGGTLTATCTTSTLVIPTDTIAASYSGDANYALASATPITQTVTKASPTLTWTAQPSGPVNLNTAATFTATLGGATFAPNAPSGTIGFLVNGKAIADCPSVTISGGTLSATCTTSTLVIPTDTIAASYSGDANYALATATPITQTVTKASPTLTWTAQPSGPVNLNTAATFTATLGGALTTQPASSVTVDTPLTFTATLGGATFTPIAPTGTISFSINGKAIADCPSVTVSATTLTATCTTSTLVAPTDTIAASYSGDANFKAASPAPITQTVTQATPTLTWTAQPSGPVNLNTAATFTATLGGATFAPNAPSGTISFLVNGKAIADCPSVTASATTLTATCTTSTLVAPTDTIAASYSGDANFKAASPAAITQTVTQATPTLSWTAQPSGPVNLNTAATFTATLGGATFAPTAPSGTISFSINGKAIADCPSVTVSATTLSATCTTSTLVAPTDTIAASYSGDANFKTASPAAITQTVTPLTPTLALTTQPASSVTVDTPLTFTATLGGATFTPIAPSGTISFSINGKAIADCPSVTVSATTLTATCTTQSFAVAPTPYSIVATYSSGDANFNGATSTAISETVTPATAKILTAPASSYVNQSVSLTVTVQAPAAGTPEVFPTGTVTFTQGAASLCTATISTTSATTGPGNASCSYAFGSAASSSTITATYSGDTNFVAGTVATFQQTVKQDSSTVAVVSASPTSVAAQSVVFTATVTPQYSAGTTPTAPGGTISFSVSNNFACNETMPETLTPSASGATSTATCTVAIPVTFTSGSFTVAAAYSGDSNFLPSSSAAATETVQNFSVAFSTQPANTSLIYLTQGYANTADPFKPVAVNMTLTPINAFNGALTNTCQVLNASTNAPVTDPSCQVSQSPESSGSGNYAVTVTASSTAALGEYFVTVTATDSMNPNLHQSPPPKSLFVYVVGATSALTLANGAVATSANAVLFDTATLPSGTAPATLTLGTSPCGPIYDLTAGTILKSTTVLCYGPSTATPTTNPQTTVGPITIIPVGAAAANSAAQRSGDIYAAALLGIPILALLGWFGRMNSSRKNFFRFLGLILMLVGVSCATGCGGSFTLASTGGGGGLTAGHNYLIQVTAQGDNGADYYAVVQLDVAN
jgi:hypothetical protein